ncbi:MAG: DNA alkylation repair protein [Acidobacteriota bacterium]
MSGPADVLAAEIASRLGALKSPKTEAIRGVRRRYSRQLAAASAREILGVARALLRRPGFLRRFVAYELISHHRAAREALRVRELEELGEGIDCWEAVDTFALYLAGPAWRQGQISDASVARWARRPDRWWRRAALVSTVALSRETGRGQANGNGPARILALCARLVDDRDDMVVKALSWALRELTKHRPEEARRFLATHRDRLAPRVLREVRNKLTTGLKNPRR